MDPLDITIGTSESKIIDRNNKRTVLTIQNTHASAIIKISSINGKSSIGIRIYPKDMIILQAVDGDRPDLPYYAISDTATTIVNLSEEFGVRVTTPQGMSGALPLIAMAGLALSERR